MTWQVTPREKFWMRLIALAMLALLAGQIFAEPQTVRYLRLAGGIGAVAIIILLALSWRRHTAEEKH